MPARTTTATDAADLARALAFARRQIRGACERALAHPFGEAFLDTRLPRAHVLNSLHVASEVDPDQLVAALDDLYAGYPHRRAYVEVDATGERLASELRRRGWQVERNVVMALRRPRDRDGDRALAREVDAATHRAADAETVRDEPYGRDEDVVTLREHRRRGLARATLTLALDAAIEMGHALVFIVADADDWPQELYARLGFDPVGHAWGFTLARRLPATAR